MGLILFITINLIAYNGENNCGDFRTWLFGSMAFYIVDLISAMNQLMAVMKNDRENLWLLLAKYVIMIGNVGWYIYGNVLFYDNWEECVVQTDTYLNGQNPGLVSGVRFMIYIGYITMFMCCCITSALAVIIPCLVVAMRRQEQPQWTGAAPNVLRRLAKGKFEMPSDPEAPGVA